MHSCHHSSTTTRRRVRKLCVVAKSVLNMAPKHSPLAATWCNSDGFTFSVVHCACGHSSMGLLRLLVRLPEFHAQFIAPDPCPWGLDADPLDWLSLQGFWSLCQLLPLDIQRCISIDPRMLKLCECVRSLIGEGYRFGPCCYSPSGPVRALPWI